MKRQRKKPRRRALLRDIALQRMEYLYRLALDAAKSGDLERAAMLGTRIREVSLRTGVRMPRRLKRSLCKNCRIPLVPGLTARVRLRTQGGMSYVVVTCKRCGWIHRYPYKRGASLGEPEGESEESAPRERRRHNREEGGDRGSTPRDRREAEKEGSSEGEDAPDR